MGIGHIQASALFAVLLCLHSPIVWADAPTNHAFIPQWSSDPFGALPLSGEEATPAVKAPVPPQATHDKPALLSTQQRPAPQAMRRRVAETSVTAIKAEPKHLVQSATTEVDVQPKRTVETAATEVDVKPKRAVQTETIEVNRTPVSPVDLGSLVETLKPYGYTLRTQPQRYAHPPKRRATALSNSVIEEQSLPTEASQQASISSQTVVPSEVYLPPSEPLKTAQLSEKKLREPKPQQTMVPPAPPRSHQPELEKQTAAVTPAAQRTSNRKVDLPLHLKGITTPHDTERTGPALTPEPIPNATDQAQEPWVPKEESLFHPLLMLFLFLTGILFLFGRGLHALMAYYPEMMERGKRIWIRMIEVWDRLYWTDEQDELAEAIPPHEPKNKPAYPNRQPPRFIRRAMQQRWASVIEEEKTLHDQQEPDHCDLKRQEEQGEPGPAVVANEEPISEPPQVACLEPLDQPTPEPNTAPLLLSAHQRQELEALPLPPPPCGSTTDQTTPATATTPFIPLNPGVESIANHFSAQDQTMGITPLVVVGMGGAGKTQLVNHYVHQNAHQFSHVWWIEGCDSQGCLQGLIKLEEKLDASFANQETAQPAGLALQSNQDMSDQERLQTIANRVIQRLISRHDWLLVIDNVSHPSMLEPILSQLRHHHLLITSRYMDWSGWAATLDLHLPEAESCAQWLQERTGKQDGEAANRLVSRVGCLPLALEQLAIFTQKAKLSLQAALAYLDRYGITVLEKGLLPSSYYPNPITTTWQRTLDRIKGENPLARTLLDFIVLLPDNQLRRDLLPKQAALLPNPLTKQVDDALAMLEAWELLDHYALIDLQVDRIELHPMVKASIRNSMSPTRRKHWTPRAIQLHRMNQPQSNRQVLPYRLVQE
ncbi:NB-ARC domain-containing protein [Magnetococcus sp. PR-3]|uniref:NB-ARC domain-containing protein n=1 Tax=Magnetococcus sp. PR-3 TaxID=3120355 RepID=UPI002FCDEC52